MVIEKLLGGSVGVCGCLWVSMGVCGCLGVSVCVCGGASWFPLASPGGLCLPFGHHLASPGPSLDHPEPYLGLLWAPLEHKKKQKIKKTNFKTSDCKKHDFAREVCVF